MARKQPSKKLWIIIEYDENILEESPSVKKTPRMTFDDAYLIAKGYAHLYMEQCKKCKPTMSMNDDEGKITIDVMGTMHFFEVMSIDYPEAEKPPKQKSHPQKKSGKVTVHVYGTDRVFNSSLEAINYYKDGVDRCDPNGSECSKYNAIIAELRRGKKNITI